MAEHRASPLTAAVLERLDYLDVLVTEGDEPSRAAVAETEVTRLTGAWRALLALHAANRHGSCAHCSRLRRRRPHPCTVWTTAHHYLITEVPAADSTERTGRHR